VKRLLFALATIVPMLLLTYTPVRSQSSGAKARPLVTMAEYQRWQTELSNWGRWGKDDEMGALNLITPLKRKQAAALVRDGVSVSLASDVPLEKGVDTPCPASWAMINATENAATDQIAFPCVHGAGNTHLDSFGHIFFSGKMWNGYDATTTVTKESGATKGSIHGFRHGIVTRAVLYDMPRLTGVPYLEPGTRIYVEDLEAWEKRSGVRVGPGDALLLRWGRWTRRDTLGPWPINSAAVGLDNSVIPWLKKRDVAIVGWETPTYAPLPEGDLPRDALHNFALTILGIPLLDRADFDAVSQAAATRNRFEFMLVIAPLRIPNGTGSPVNPIAVF
jgi:kynurenine formamidase